MFRTERFGTRNRTELVRTRNELDFSKWQDAVCFWWWGRMCMMSHAVLPTRILLYIIRAEDALGISTTSTVEDALDIHRRHMRQEVPVDTS